MSRYALTRKAMADLDAVEEYLSRENSGAPGRVLTKLREAMRQLADTPGIGHLREDLADEPLRFWTVYSYLIVYRPETRPIQIIRVLHAARASRRFWKGDRGLEMSAACVWAG